MLAYLAALRLGGLPQARAVAFASVVGTQLVQTLDMGCSIGKLSTPVLGSVAGSAGMMALALGVPAARAFLGLAIPSPASWVLIGGSTLAALLFNRLTFAQLPPAPQRILAQPAADETSASIGM